MFTWTCLINILTKYSEISGEAVDQIGKLFFKIFLRLYIRMKNKERINPIKKSNT
jgi:hypothetical protein